MTDEHPNISRRDHRLEMITTLAADYHSPSTGITHPEGTPIQLQQYVKYGREIIGTNFPSAPALFLSFASKAAVEGGRLVDVVFKDLEAPEFSEHRHTTDANEGLFFDALEYLLACVIFSYSALESFANAALPEGIQHTVVHHKTGATNIYGKADIERWIGLDTKLDEILPPVFGVKSPKGTALWRDYRALSTIRDESIHLKSQGWRRPSKPEDNLWTKLLDPIVLKFPRRAAELIAHYSNSSEMPRWLKKSGLIGERT